MANRIVDYFKSTLEGMGVEVLVFNITDHSIPFFSEDAMAKVQEKLSNKEKFPFQGSSMLG